MKRLSFYSTLILSFLLISCASKSVESGSQVKGKNIVKNSMEPILSEECSAMEQKIIKNWSRNRIPTVIISLCYDQRFGDSTVSKVTDWVQGELEEFFVNSDSLSVVDKSNMNKVIKEQKFQNSIIIDDDQMTEVGRILGGDYIIFSKINQFGKLELKVTNVETAQLIYSKTISTILEDSTEIDISEPALSDISAYRTDYEGIVLRISQASVPKKYDFRLIKVGSKNGVEYYTSFDQQHSDTEWGTRFVEIGKKYTIQVMYYDNHGIMKDFTNKIVVVAQKGVGELECVQYLDYEVTDNTVHYTQQPKFTLGGEPLDEDFIEENYSFYIHVNVDNMSQNWKWLTCSNDVGTFTVADRKLTSFNNPIVCLPEDELTLRAHISFNDDFNEYGGFNVYLYGSELKKFNYVQ